MKFRHRAPFILLILSLLGFYVLSVLHVKPIVSYTIVYVASSLLYLLVAMVLKKKEVTKTDFVWLLGSAIVLRLAFLTLQPVGSPDYYRYVWDGKVEAHGINPYRYAPDDSALTGLHSETLPRLVTYPAMRTIYPPVSEGLFYAAYSIAGESYVGTKILILLFDLATMVGLVLLLTLLNQDRKYLLLYALCPLTIVQFFLDAHVDIFGFVFLISAIYSFIRERKLAAYLLLGLSMSVKPLALIVVPIFFFTEKGIGNRLKAAAIPLVVLGISYLPFVFTGKPFQALLTFTENWTFNGVVFHVLNSFIHDNQRTRLICALLLLATYIPIILSRRELIEKIYLSIFLLFIFSPIVHPWYIGWLVVLLPLVPRWSGIAYAALSSLTVFTILNYQMTGVWKDYPPVLIVEYVPVLILFLWELNRKARRASSTQGPRPANL